VAISPRVQSERRAIGIVRVSQVAGREGESFISPAQQRDQVREACRRDGLSLIETIDELDVSGGTPLEKRAGLRGAVEAVEAGRAEVIVAAYFDRLVRSLRVQGELVSRVEKAGGQILALDVGAITEGTAGQWLSGTVMGAMNEYQARVARERSGAAQARAVARGVCPWPDVPFGYLRGEEGVLVPSPDAPKVVEAFEMRADGATIKAINEHLGVTYTVAQRMLSNRVYLGEIHFGKLVNPKAHEPIVPRDLWQRVQRIRVPRGRQPKSDRLLARLGVLRCGGCGGAMGASTGGDGSGGKVPVYRCPNSTSGNCSLRANISAPIAERVVVEAVKDRLRDLEGRASVEADAQDAASAAGQAQANYEASIRAFAGHEDEPAAIERLAELRGARDSAVAKAEHLRGRRTKRVVRIAARWNDLPTDRKRAYVRSAVRALVGPGRGADRITVELAGEVVRPEAERS
jgi:DNA invertase Pin-like site-specific DNA recombinase